MAGDPGEQGKEELLAVPVERRAAPQEAEQRGSQGVDVGLAAELLPVDHLGRGMGDAEELVACPRLGGSQHPGDAEVTELRLPEAGQQHVLRLEIAMEDAVAMGRLHRARQPHADVDDLLPREGALPRQKVGEGAVREVLHGQVGDTVGGEPRLVHGDDVRVTGKGADGGTLALELPPGPLVEPYLRQDLDRHEAVERRLAGPVDRREAALADQDRLSVPGNSERLGIDHGGPLRSARVTARLRTASLASRTRRESPLSSRSNLA